MQVGGVGATWSYAERLRPQATPGNLSIASRFASVTGRPAMTPDVAAVVPSPFATDAATVAREQYGNGDDKGLAQSLANASTGSQQGGSAASGVPGTANAAESEQGSAGVEVGASATPGADTAENQAEQREIQELAETDRHVRAHEQAHLAAAGGLASGGASFEYQRGPDNQQYAVGGEVSIDVSPGRTPQETIAKAARIRAAALAPADPSGQDRAVAAAATAMATQASAELAKQAMASAAASDTSASVAATTRPAATSTSADTPEAQGSQRLSGLPALSVSGSIASLATTFAASRAYAGASPMAGTIVNRHA